METAITKVIEAMAADIIGLTRGVMEKKGVARDSKLVENICSEVLQSENGCIINLLFENYIDYIEQGRRPKLGKRPPIEMLRDWAIRKGIEPSNDSLWAISTVIWRDGIEPRPIMVTVESLMDEWWEQKWFDELANVLVRDLSKYFE